MYRFTHTTETPGLTLVKSRKIIFRSLCMLYLTVRVTKLSGIKLVVNVARIDKTEKLIRNVEKWSREQTT